tara:strand:- start:489 stop:1202 length:714 start_codon:yes stop_codon:yes gene_type:complete
MIKMSLIEKDSLAEYEQSRDDYIQNLLDIIGNIELKKPTRYAKLIKGRKDESSTRYLNGLSSLDENILGKEYVALMESFVYKFENWSELSNYMDAVKSDFGFFLDFSKVNLDFKKLREKFDQNNISIKEQKERVYSNKRKTRDNANKKLSKLYNRQATIKDQLSEYQNNKAESLPEFIKEGSVEITWIVDREMEINLYSQINEDSFDKIKTAYWSRVEKRCLLNEVLEDILNLVETD